VTKSYYFFCHIPRKILSENWEKELRSYLFIMASKNLLVGEKMNDTEIQIRIEIDLPTHLRESDGKNYEIIGRNRKKTTICPSDIWAIENRN